MPSSSTRCGGREARQLIERPFGGVFVSAAPRTALCSLAGVLLAWPLAVSPATIVVGPQEPIKHIAQAARLARDGDTVLIMPGDYRGDVAVWEQHRLTIRGANPRPVLHADGRSAEGKAIWVFRNGDFRVENVEFRGAAVADENGAGIRFEKGRLEVVGCHFIGNQHGILTANFADAELTVRDSLFSSAPRWDGAPPHLIYVGRIARFHLEGSRFHQGYRGHLVKSRARHSEIRYNLIFDGPGGQASYELEFPNAGEAIVVGNVIGQSATSHNPVIVAYGAEGSAWPVNRLFMAHNTLVNEGWRPAWFARAWTDTLPADTRIVTRNNLSVGLGAFTLGLRGDHAGNIPLPAWWINPDTLDFSLGAGSLLRGSVAAPEGELASELTPSAEFRLPAGTQALSPPDRWAPGAFQSAVPPQQPPVFQNRSDQSPMDTSAPPQPERNEEQAEDQH